MHSEKRTKILAAITILLMTASIALLSNFSSISAEAQTTSQPSAGALPAGANPSVTITTDPFLGVSPSTIGVGQSVLVNMWLHPPINVNRQFLKAFEIVITKPDGTTEKIGGIDSYAGDSTAWLEYPISMVGTYKFKFNFLGMWFPAGRYFFGQIVTNSSGQVIDSAYYKPSSTPEVSITAQQDMIYSYPPAALPTDYWTRPASPENREWWSILGNWPNTGIVGGGQYWPADTNTYMSNYNFVPYVQGPNTAHVVWKRQNNIGGLIGGIAGQISVTIGGLTGSGYPTLIYSGRCYEVISEVNTTTNVAAQNFWRCYDLRTGQIYWERMIIQGETIPTWIEYAKQGEEVPGASARAGINVYLVAITGASGSNDGRILKYDPWTGAIAYNITGVPSGVAAGTLYGYPNVYSIQTSGSKYFLIRWNVENNGGNWAYGGGGGQTTVTNFTQRIKSNISWPFSSLGTCDFETGVAVTVQGINSNGTGTSVAQRLIGVNINTGAVMWNITTDLNSGIETFFSSGTGVSDHGKYAGKMQNGEVWAWDLMTGNIAWKSKMPSWPWGVFGAYHVQSAYGLLIHNDYDGVRAINWTSGNVEWVFRAPTPAFETPYNSQQAWHSSGVVADGKLYTFTCEHTPSQPLTRDWKLYCINMTNGENVWNISTGQSIPGSRYIMGAVADGYLAYTNEYNFYLYVYGKGQSKTTVTAPQTTVAKGTSVLIQGTVLDQSPAQPDTPCISRESMTTYMEYLHAQQPIDGKYHNATVTGVPVTLLVLDQTGAITTIGSTSSDMSGTFAYQWTPPGEGVYRITATFPGDDSYGSSWAETGLSVGPAPTEITIPEQATPPDYTMPLIAGFLAVIIAVAIVGILVIKKK